MERGFLRRWIRPLGGALGLACLVFVSALAMTAGRSTAAGQTVPSPPSTQKENPLQYPPPSARSWWEVGVVVEVKGDYAVRGGESPVSGVYSYKARWNGRLELDSAGDFLLVHLGTEVLDWHLRETARPGGRESVIEAAAGTKPVLRMEYLIKDGQEVEFVFGLGSITVPLHEPGLGLSLDLPRTSARQPSLPGRSYGNFVCRGSCRVAVPEADFVKQAPQRCFSWYWRREKVQSRQDREAVTLVENHAADAAVTVIVH